MERSLLVEEITALVLQEVTPIIKKKMNPVEKRYLTLNEAAHYSGIGVKRIKSMAIRGVIDGFPDPGNKTGAWRIDRQSIDRYCRDNLLLLRQGDRL